MNIPAPVPQFAEGARVAVRERLYTGGVRAYFGTVVRDNGVTVVVKCDMCGDEHGVDQTEVEPADA